MKAVVKNNWRLLILLSILYCSIGFALVTILRSAQGLTSEFWCSLAVIIGYFLADGLYRVQIDSLMGRSAKNFSELRRRELIQIVWIIIVLAITIRVQVKPGLQSTICLIIVIRFIRSHEWRKKQLAQHLVHQHESDAKP